jgi:hypothetical protein
MKEIKQKIEDYVSNVLFQHDLSSWRNETNKAIMNKIIAKCMSDLETKDGLLELFENDKQVEYFVRQTILYLVLQ